MVTVTTLLNRAAGAIRREIVRQLKAGTAIPYCAIYSVSGTFAPPQNYSVSDYPGLMAWHVVPQVAAYRIVSYWQDEAHYQYAKSRFENTLGLAGCLAWDGATGDLHAKDPTWWPSSLKEAVIAVAAIIGAAGVIWTTGEKVYQALWGSPQITVSFGIPTLDISENRSAQVPITLTNTGFAPVEVKARASFIGSDGGPNEIRLEPPTVPGLDINGTRSLIATVSAPAFKPGLSSKAGYSLSVSANVRTWAFGSVTNLPSSSIPVNIWPQKFGYTERPERVPESNARVYQGAGYLYTGMAFQSGLRATVEFEADEHSDLVVAIPDFVRSVRPVDPSPPFAGKRSFLVEFVSPPLEKFEKRRFQILVSPKAGQQAPADWAIVAHSLKVHFDRME